MEIDQATERALDQIVEDEVRASYKDVELPPDYYAVLRQDRELDPAIPLFKRARIYKYSPKRRRQVQAAVMKQYHADLKDESILSTAQLRDINVKRGEWSAEREREMARLSDEVGRLSRELYVDGLDPQTAWTGDLGKLCAQYRAMVSDDGEAARVPDAAKREQALGWFDRWLEWSPARQAEYTEQYAKEQGREAYSADRDLQALLDTVGGVDAYELLDEIQVVKDKLERYVELLEKRTKHYEIQIQHAKIFAESVEHRRDNAEEMARLFFCVYMFDDAKGQYVPLAKSLEDLWNLPDEVIQWLLIRIYLFFNAIPEEAEKMLETMGFLVAPRRGGSQEQSGASPAEPSSSPGSPPAPTTA